MDLGQRRVQRGAVGGLGCMACARPWRFVVARCRLSGSHARLTTPDSDTGRMLIPPPAPSPSLADPVAPATRYVGTDQADQRTVQPCRSPRRNPCMVLAGVQPEGWLRKREKDKTQQENG